MHNYKYSDILLVINMILTRIQPTIIKHIEPLRVQGYSPRRVHLLAIASSRNGLLASGELGASWRWVKLGALGLFDIFLTKTSFLSSLFIFLIWKLSQSSLKISRYLKLSISRLITTFQKSRILRHYSQWRVVLLARRAMNITHLLWRVMLLAAASDECLYGQNAFFSQKSQFSQFQSPKRFTDV